jgi:hypothetical protein
LRCPTNALPGAAILLPEPCETGLPRSTACLCQDSAFLLCRAQSESGNVTSFSHSVARRMNRRISYALLAMLRETGNRQIAIRSFRVMSIDMKSNASDQRVRAKAEPYPAIFVFECFMKLYLTLVLASELPRPPTRLHHLCETPPRYPSLPPPRLS